MLWEASHSHVSDELAWEAGHQRGVLGLLMPVWPAKCPCLPAACLAAWLPALQMPSP